MKKNIFLTLLLFLSFAVVAQEQDANDDDKSVRPSKRNFTVGISMGNSPFFNTPSIFSGANVSGDATSTTLNLRNNSFVNMVGIDARYFVSNRWAVTFSGAMSYSETPAEIAFPAAGPLPAYNATVQEGNMNFTYALGAVYFFDYKKNDRIMPYLGLSVPVSHARVSQFDPSIVNNAPVQLGQAHVEALGIGAQVVAGIDYYIADGIFLGASIRPVSFQHVGTTRYPGPGLLSKKASSYNFSTFVQPMLTLGFKL